MNRSGCKDRKRVGRPFERGNPYRFAPGHPGGPRRPLTKHVAQATEQRLGRRIPKDHPIAKAFPELRGETFAYALVYGQILAANKGNVAAANFVADLAESKVATLTESTANGDEMFRDPDGDAGQELRRS
jgi:hypothetical protein